LEAGWTVSEVGRQPWIVYKQMKVEDAATANTGVWLLLVAVVPLYTALGVTTILVLRGMSRRFRARADAGESGVGESQVAYGPNEPVAVPEEPVSEEPVR
jgi:cytochrome d ubiquinol oxidase subunit I